MAEINKAIERFLTISSGYGSGSGSGDGSGYGSGYGYGSGDGSGSGDGYGDGSGYGSGDGDGSGDGYGDGYGYGSGDGSGDGDGDGDGVNIFNGQRVYMIDGLPTLIYSVRGSIARGAILRKDLTLQDCYIARVGNSFAHGKTAHAAMCDATAKDLEQRPLEERIAEFKKKFPSLDTKASGKELYDWHHVLTGSCKMGRDEFCQAKGVKMDEQYTIAYFLEITATSYGSQVINQLKEIYK